MTSVDALASLEALCGLRTAPELSDEQRNQLRSELRERMDACEWFTVGIMAADGSEAIAALRQLERAAGWQALEGEGPEGDPAGDAQGAGVFLKANQNTGGFRLRLESGLGLGVLITGHSAVEPEAEGTWGPFPLDFFA
jgi:hypothetical protein